jgi:hypothetical protein
MPVNLKKDDMGDVIKDFYKSDAPQFKGKSKKKRRQMAIAAKLSAESALYFQEQQRHWSKGYDSGDKTVPRRKALDRAEYFDNRGENERAHKIRRIAISKDHGDDYEARKKAKNIKISNKIGKLRPASIDDKRGAVSGDVQKKLSSSYELEGETLDEKLGSWKQAIKSRDKAAKSIKTGKSPSHKARRRKRSKPGGTEKLSNVNKSAENKSMQSVGGFRGAHGASRKSKSSQGPAARIEYRRKSPADAPKKHDTESVKKVGTFVSLKKNVSESKLDRVMHTVRKYTNKVKPKPKTDEKKPQKDMSAGGRARRLLQRKEYADKVSGSTDIVPDNIRN